MAVPLPRAVRSAGLMLAVMLAGCSSSGSSGSSPGPSGSPGGADATTTRTITRAFHLFFDTNTALGKSVSVLQHGPTFRSTLVKESKSPSAVDITAKVSAVNVVNNNVAKVTFTIYSGKTTLLPNNTGYAVREGGTWKVAAQTFCALLKLEGTAPAACDHKSITSLHG
jgi:hypothetical protein